MNLEPIRLETPLRLEDVELLRSGDVVLLYGVLYAARDAAHARMEETIEKGEPLPFDPEGQVIYYTGPAPARPGSPLGPAGAPAPSRAEPLTALLNMWFPRGS